MASTVEGNRAIATRFIEAFNTDDWDAVRDVVTPDFVFHRPEGGTVAAGPEGMVAAWSGFKAAVPDAWHPIPVMITEGDTVAVLLPTYGHFTGDPYHGIPPTGEWLEYGMVNMVRLVDGRIAEAWFGMDPLAEKQQMGIFPVPPARRLSDRERANLDLFRETMETEAVEHDTVTAFGDVVVALGPPQSARDAKVREIDVYLAENGALSLLGSREFPTIPPYGGDLSADTDASRGVVARFYEEVLIGHDLDAIARLVAPDILIHATAMPCEASAFGRDGMEGWLKEQWIAFPDLTIAEHILIACGDMVAVRWQAHGTSRGPFMMVPPSGDRVEFTGISMYRVSGDRLAELWDTRNRLGILTQINPDLGHRH